MNKILYILLFIISQIVFADVTQESGNTLVKMNVNATSKRIHGAISITLPSGYITYYKDAGLFGFDTKIQLQVNHKDINAHLKWPIPESKISNIDGTSVRNLVYRNKASIGFDMISKDIKILSANVQYAQCGNGVCIPHFVKLEHKIR